jgi:hypothetical protein
MKQSNALELRTRMTAVGADAPFLVVVTRRRTPESDTTVKACDQAARAFGVDAVTLDVDAADNHTLLDDLSVRFAPEVLLCARGVVLERAAGVRDADDAYGWIASTLRKPA